MENILDFEADYRATVDHYPNRWPRPVIGITGNYGPAGCELAEVTAKPVEKHHLRAGFPIHLAHQTSSRCKMGSMA